jgi:replicative DNA helicase
MEKNDRTSAECGVVGAMLLDGALVRRIWTRIRAKPSWFGHEGCREVVLAVLRLWTDGNPIDALTVAAELRKANKLDAVGGMAFLEMCYESCATAMHADYYMDLLRMESVRRNIRKVFSDAAQQLDSETPELLVPRVTSAMDSVLQEHEGVVEDRPADIYAANLARWEKARADREAGIKPDIGVEFPWTRVTKMVGGLQAGLHILGARPSTGKTTMEGMIRVHAAMKGVKVLCHQIDMSKDGLLLRDQCRVAGVSYKKLHFGYARRDQLAAVAESTEMLKKLPMNFIFGNTNIEVLQARARALRGRGELDLITVDCGQLLTYAGSGRAEVAERSERISGMLKALALELNIPLLCLCQLRRPIDQKAKYSKPDMEDIHGGRFWEANALTVALLYRDEKVWDQWMTQAKEECEQDHKKWRECMPKYRPIVWLQAKNQNGENSVFQRFLLNTNYFQFLLANQDWSEAGEETWNEGMTEDDADSDSGQ